MDESWTPLALVQPTRRREWELRRGDEKVAELRLPAMRSGGSAQRSFRREIDLAMAKIYLNP